MELRKYRYTMFFGKHKDGSDIVVSRNYWEYNRGKILAQMERNGCAGEVRVIYCEADGKRNDTKREVICGI